MTSGYAFQGSYADFLPFLKNEEVVSQPVKQWKIESVVDLAMPRSFEMALISK